jgi:hypothetical protein
MPPVITYVGILLAVYVLAECINLFMVGSSLSLCLFRIVRQMLHGSKEVALPEDLKIAATNGLLTVGSEVVVGTEHQWDGFTVRRFAISPSIVHADVGAIMQIIRLTRSSIELKPLANSEFAATTNNQPGEQDATSNGG